VFSAANQLFRQTLPSACRLKADKRQKSRNTSRAGSGQAPAGRLKGGDKALFFAAGALMPLLRPLTARQRILPPDESRGTGRNRRFGAGMAG